MAMERGRLLVFDVVAMKAQGEADIKIGREPAHVIVDPAGRSAYASNAEDNRLSIVDLAQRKVIGEIKTGKRPHGLRMSPDGREIYGANTGDNSVSVVDVATAKEVARIVVGKAPAQVGFTPDGRRVYVSSAVDDSVAVWTPSGADASQRYLSAASPSRYSPRPTDVGLTVIAVAATPDDERDYGVEGSGKRSRNFLAA